jgi:hypothetical protein
MGVERYTKLTGNLVELKMDASENECTCHYCAMLRNLTDSRFILITTSTTLIQPLLPMKR